MRRRYLSVALLACATVGHAQTPASSSGRALNYPPARRGPQVDNYFGTTVADPYRWLEDINSPETRAWIAAENELTVSYLSDVPGRSDIRDRLGAVWNYPKYDAPFKEGGRYFYFENSGLQNQSVLYVKNSRDDRPRVLLDPNTLSADGTVALGSANVSPSGRYLAYSVASGGSDWVEFRVRDVNTGRDMVDTLRWVKFSGAAWTRDNKGFFYSRYDAPAAATALSTVVRNQKLYYHRLGQPQARDQLIYERPDQPDWLFGAQVSEDGQYAVISVAQGTDTRNRLYFIDLANPGRPDVSAPVVKLIDVLDATYDFIGNSGTAFYLRTNSDAPRGRIVAVNINSPRRDRWQTLVPETGDALTSATIAGDVIAASYLKDASSVVRLYGPPGPGAARAEFLRKVDSARKVIKDTVTRGRGERGRIFSREFLLPGFTLRAELPLPGLGTVGQINGKPGDDEMFYSFSSFLVPRTVYRYDLKQQRNELYRAPKIAFDPSPYETRQVFYTSKDGTRVPMFITARKGVALDGSNPTILYGYGGFDISVTPSFSPQNIVWLQMGGIYAVANLRGGGEYGKAWHEAGTFARKQNVFDDFIAAAEYLIREKYTSTPRLAIMGASNGGLLVGAVETQRPDLFGAAIPSVGVMDMLRFQKFTIGWAWASDYGSSDDSTQFSYLYKYSPLQNIRPGTKYPPTLVLTADRDDRVVPGHSFKFAATMQAAQAGPAPILIRVDTRAGHGAGKPTDKQIETAADGFAFLVKSLGITVRLQ